MGTQGVSHILKFLSCISIPKRWIQRGRACGYRNLTGLMWTSSTTPWSGWVKRFLSWGKAAFSAAGQAAHGSLGVSALYPPHLYGLTQFSKGLAAGGGDRLREAKNTTWCIRQLRCRGIPRIALPSSTCWHWGVHKLPEGSLSVATTRACFWDARCRVICMPPINTASGGWSSGHPVLWSALGEKELCDLQIRVLGWKRHAELWVRCGWQERVNLGLCHSTIPCQLLA